ncbi:hypothetical protein M8J77_019656 [Diaphorina citri]|nr:hypothetical protein M8J77_019656 [Diaphorina citri]
MIFLLPRVLLAILVVAILSLTAHFSQSSRLTEIFNWKQVDFAFPNEEERRLAQTRGQFVAENCLPVSLDKWHDRLFLAVPRHKNGVPSTLNYVMLPNSNNKNKSITSPILMPYPSWESNVREARNLTSVVKVQSDPCDRLWALDSGVVEGKMEQPPSVQVYDLRQQMQIRFFQLKEKTDYTEESKFSNMVVDVTSANCDDAFLYIADSGHNHIVVYNYRTNDSHIIHHNYLHFDPLFGDFTIGGVNFQWQTGIHGMSLSPLTRDNFRVMYFHPLASTTEFAVTTKVLQNRSLDFSRSNFDFKVMGSRGTGSQSGASSLDEETGVIFYALLVKSGVGCWNTFRGEEYNEKSMGLVAEDNATLIYPSDIRVDRTGVLWVLSNKLPVFLYSKLKPEDINVRIFKSTVRNAIKGTVCDEM